MDLYAERLGGGRRVGNRFLVVLVWVCIVVALVSSCFLWYRLGVFSGAYVDLMEEYEAFLDLDRGCVDCEVVLLVGGESVLFEELDEITFFLSAARRFRSARAFEKEVYDCKNFSRDFSLVMGELGFEVDVAAGLPLNGSEGHAWNRVVFDFEPQTGSFFDSSLSFPVGVPDKFLEVIRSG